MRVWLVMIPVLGLAGCTGMLLGGGQGGGTAERAPRSSMQVATDNALAVAVRRRFNDDALLSQYDLRIEAHNGRVTLRGTVGSYSARDRAVSVASSVDGVDGVSNLIRVASGT